MDITAITADGRVRADVDAEGRVEIAVRDGSIWVSAGTPGRWNGNITDATAAIPDEAYDELDSLLSPQVEAARCQCGTITGEQCCGPLTGERVVIEWVPPYLRGTALAAGGDTFGPYAEKLSVDPECADLLLASDESSDWIRRI